MTKETAWKIFKFFSILLIVDFALMPIASLIDPKSEGCGDYNLLTCIGLFLSLPAIVGFVWVVFWWGVYATLFINEQQMKEWGKRFPIATFLLLSLGRGPYEGRGLILAGHTTLHIVLFFCVMIAYFFFYQLWHIAKILF